MTKRTKVAFVGIVMALPILAGACKIPIGGGCSIVLMETGVKYGVVCN